LNTDELLNYLEDTYPTTEKGRVTGLSRYHSGVLEEVPLPAGAEGYVDAHPEGSDRGGYVPWLEVPGASPVFYYEPEGEWSY
jgi:hypothetical protein